MDSDILREVRPSDDLVPPLDPTLLKLSDDEHAFLRAAISNDDDILRERILRIQKEAYEVYPYPCVHAFHFVAQMMRTNPVYASVLEAGKAGQTVLLDLGCMMGTDARRLTHDGYKAGNILGCDLRDTYLELGYSLYGDKDTCPIRFFTDDILDLPLATASSDSKVGLAEVKSLEQLRGELDHVYTGALFHLFDEATQLAIALRVATLLRRAPGAVVFGRHQGRPEAGLIADHMSRVRWAHSPETWRVMWKTAFGRLEGAEWADTHVVVDAELRSAVIRTDGEKQRLQQMMYWAVRIV